MATASVVDPALEERWAAWRVRGLRHDMAVQRRMRVIALISAIVLGLVMLGIVAGRSL